MKTIVEKYIRTLSLVTALLIIFSCRSAQHLSSDERTITIAAPTIPTASLVFIAGQNGHYEDHGLSVSLKKFSSGRLSLEALLKKEVDFAVAAETPISKAIMDNRKIKILATIGSSEWEIAILVDRDAHINSPKDLIGKTIGTVQGTNSEYYLSRFLMFHNIPINRVKVLYISPEGAHERIRKKELAAVSLWEPHITKIKMNLGDRVDVWFNSFLYTSQFNLVTRNDILENKREEIPFLIKSLIAAEASYEENPEKALAPVSVFLGQDPIQLLDQASRSNLNVYLNQSLVSALEEEGRWFIGRENRKKDIGTACLQAFYPEPLRSIKPEAVTLVYPESLK